MRVVIMAAGLARRWPADFPKQMALVHNEPVLYRTVRQLRARGIEPIVTARHRGQWNLFNEYVSTPNEVEIDRLWGARKLFPAIYLYGDVYYTDRAVETILSDDRDWAFFGRRHANRLKPYGELFAIKPDRRVLAVAGSLRRAYLRGRVDRCLGWDLYWACLGHTTRISTRRGVPPNERLVDVDDATDDFDTVDEYLRFLAINKFSHANFC